LPPTALEVLRTAAVFGREFGAALLAEVLGRSEADTLAALDEAARARLLQEDPERRLHYRFVHLLVRDVLYENLGAHPRAQLHWRIATVLEAHHRGAANIRSELAHHFSATGTRAGTEKAIDSHSEAAAVAAARFDHASSLAHYGSALELLASLPEATPARRCDLQLSMARQALQAGFSENAGALWLAAAEQARAIPDPLRLRSAALELAAAFHSHGHVLWPVHGKAMQLLEDAAALADPDDAIARARLCARLAQLLELIGQGTRADEVAGRAFGLARDAGDTSLIVDVLSLQRTRLIGTPEASTRARIAGEILQHAERAGDGAALLHSHVALASDLAELGRFEEWEACVAAHARLARRLNSPEGKALVHRNHAMRALMLGRFAEARAVTQQALRFAEHCEPRVASELFAIAGATMLETAEPLTGVHDQLQLRAGLGLGWYTAEIVFLTVQQRRDLVAQKLGPAMDRIRPRRWRSESWQVSAAMLSEGIAFAHDRRHAEEALDWLQDFEPLQVLSGSGGLYFGPFRRYLGLLQATLGQWREASELLEESLRAMQAFGAAPWIVRLHLDLSWLHLRRGAMNDRKTAASHAQAGLSLAESFDMAMLKRVARRRVEDCLG
jgi:tetratricopeptide (TPR) repeat protein